MFGAVVTFIGSVVITAFNVHRVLRIWRDRAYFERKAREFRLGFYSMEVRRGLVRGWLPFTVGFAALAVFAAVNLYLRAMDQSPTGALLDLMFILVLILILGGALMLLIAWFNVPKILVPPYLRAEPGVRAHRRRA